MPFTSGPTITAPVRGDVLVQFLTGYPRHLRVTVVISTTYGFDALLEVVGENGEILRDLVLKVGQAMWSSPRFDIVLPSNSRVRVVMRDTPPVMPSPLEIQASLLYTEQGER